MKAQTDQKDLFLEKLQATNQNVLVLQSEVRSIANVQALTQKDFLLKTNLESKYKN